MAIKQEINTPSNNIGDYTLLLAGTKKVGKTALCSQFPNHFIFEFEIGNASHLNCSYKDIHNLATLNTVLAEAEKTNWFNTVIVDEVAVLYEMCTDAICKKEGVLDPQEVGFGRGWKAIGRMFNGYLRRFQALPGGNIYTAHSEVKTTKTRNEREVSKLETTLTGAAQKIMDRMTHFWGVMDFEEGNKRVMYIEGDDFVKAGHGFKETHFKEIKEGKIPLGNSPKEAYKNFMDAWHNRPIGTKSVKVQTEEKPKRQGITIGKKG